AGRAEALAVSPPFVIRARHPRAPRASFSLRVPVFRSRLHEIRSLAVAVGSRIAGHGRARGARSRATRPGRGDVAVAAARAPAAREDAGGAHELARGRAQEVAAQVRRTYAAYYKADQELRLHLEHVGLTSRVLELARLNQRTGHGSLQDTLRLEVELTRLHTDVARIEREQRSSRALLNALMDRQPDAPLGPPEAL